MTPVQGSLLAAPVAQRRTRSLTQQLADFFRAHPHEWIDGLKLEFAGSYAWRSRLSNCRTEFGMTIENRQRRVVTASGRSVKRSEYRYIPAENAGTLSGAPRLFDTQPERPSPASRNGAA